MTDQPLIASTAPAALAATSSAAAVLAWDLMMGLLVIVALARILNLPAERCRYRPWTKVGWILGALCVAWTIGDYVVPIGAIAAIYRTRRPKECPREDGIPFAEGEPGWPEETVR